MHDFQQIHRQKLDQLNQQEQVRRDPVKKYQTEVESLIRARIPMAKMYREMIDSTLTRLAAVEDAAEFMIMSTQKPL